MKKKWIHIARSFKEANEFDEQYYLSMTPKERIETMEFLRANHHKWKKGRGHGKYSQRLQRVIRIVE